MHNIKCVTSDKPQQEEREKKQNWKHPQGIFISVNEVCHHILKYTEDFTNLNFVMIQTTSLKKKLESHYKIPTIYNQFLLNLMLMSLIIPESS